MTAAHIAEALNGRRSGAGWIAHCLAHKDRTPSLSIRQSEGRILVHCFGGCTQQEVIAALRRHGIWPETPRMQWTPIQKREYWRRRNLAEAAAMEGEFWRAAVIVQLNTYKISASDEGDDDALARAASLCHLLESGSPTDVIREFIRQREANPVEVRRLIGLGRERDLEARRITAEAVLLLARAGARD